MQPMQCKYSSDNVEQRLNPKARTCAIMLWPMVAVAGSIMRLGEAGFVFSVFRENTSRSQ